MSGKRKGWSALRNIHQQVSHESSTPLHFQDNVCDVCYLSYKDLNVNRNLREVITFPHLPISVAWLQLLMEITFRITNFN